MESLFRPPGLRVLLTAGEELVLLAGRLWDPLDPSPSAGDGALFELSLGLRPGPVAAPPAFALEAAQRWTLSAERIDLEIPGFLGLTIDLPGRRATGWAADSLLRAEPSLVARLLLETPVGVLASRTTHAVLHAGAVCGPRGAVVLRGASGAGKSTLVGAAFQAGLSVLGDESVLALRADPDELAASVRELTLTPESARLLGIEGERSFSGGEEKRRIDLFASGSSSDRTARRAASILLGPRSPGPARLIALGREEFVGGFSAGAVSEETGDPFLLADVWGRSAAFRLLGAEDLKGALELLRSLVD